MGKSLRISPKKPLSRKGPRSHLRIPPSKSHTMRALLMGALLPGTSRIDRMLSSPDTDRLLTSLELLGARIIKSDSDQVMMTGRFPWNEMSQPLDVGNSGIQLRFLAALASLSSHVYQIQGDSSLSAMRPVGDLLNGLAQLGAKYTYLGEVGRAPFTIQGPIRAGRVFLAGRDSQPVSALLIALAFLGEGEVIVEDPQEIPWIKMTLGWLFRLGAEVGISSDYRVFKIKRGITKSSFDFTIPSDYSSLAYAFSMSLVTGVPVALSSFAEIYDEGDAAFLRHIQEDLSGDYHLEQNLLIPSMKWNWQKSSINLSDCIDLTSLFAVLATRASAPILMTGIGGAKEKECDRLTAIALELKKMKGEVHAGDETLLIQPSSLRGAILSSWDDHRMVFALSIAAMMADGDTVIENASCILKSYPCYVEEMQRLGFDWEWV